MSQAPGVLYVVATPIGNLDDITLRALEVLRGADIVAAEDTRHTRKLLTRFDIHAQLTSYHDHNKHEKAPVLIERMRQGQSVALVSDAGTPLVADPGYFLVGEAHRAGLRVVPVPGPCAAITALSVAGLPTDAFTFLGYLPPRSAARRKRLADLAESPHTLVLYESPHRLLKCLNDALEALGDREAAVCRELTKLHEEIARGPLSELVARFTRRAPKGEAVLLIAGLDRKARKADKAGKSRKARDEAD
jgi:16S rRNA (cytidine1402-2'-O)-methyltransferase